MSKTAAYVRYAVVPSFPRLPLEHPGLSIANRRPFSRDFFNSIDPLQPVASRVADVRGLLLIGQRRLGDAGIILKAITGRWAYHGATPISRRGDSVMDRRVPIDGMAAVIDVVSRNVRPILSAAPAKQPAMRRW